MRVCVLLLAASRREKKDVLSTKRDAIHIVVLVDYARVRHSVRANVRLQVGVFDKVCPESTRENYTTEERCALLETN